MTRSEILEKLSAHRSRIEEIERSLRHDFDNEVEQHLSSDHMQKMTASLLSSVEGSSRSSGLFMESLSLIERRGKEE
jgi:hypothetical protein